MNEPLSVGQLCGWLRYHLEDELPPVAVVGEIADYKRHSSGHHYFELKERNERVLCVCWQSNAARLRFAPANGLQVLVRGPLTYYGPHAKIQINVQSMSPIGVGAADMALRLLTEKIRGLGWMDRPRKPLPRFPRRVALVTSASSAAVRDMVQSFANRWPLCELVIANCRVQGATAPAEIAGCLKSLNALHESRKLVLDAIIVGRGGGSGEDLMAFNAESVVAAIVASTVPVVSAIGHEVDRTLADAVADAGAETPSNAVTLITPSQSELKTSLLTMRDRFRESLHGKVIQAERRLEMIATRPAFARPLDRLRRGEQRLDDLGERLRNAMLRRVERSRVKVAALAAQLESVSPLNVLKRGYSLTRTVDGAVLRDAGQVSAGAEIVTSLASGEVRSTVINTQAG